MGSESDRTMYNLLDVYRKPERFLSSVQQKLADVSYTGDGNEVAPFKRNVSTS